MVCVVLAMTSITCCVDSSAAGTWGGLSLRSKGQAEAGCPRQEFFVEPSGLAFSYQRPRWRPSTRVLFWAQACHCSHMCKYTHTNSCNTCYTAHTHTAAHINLSISFFCLISHKTHTKYPIVIIHDFYLHKFTIAERPGSVLPLNLLCRDLANELLTKHEHHPPRCHE